MNKNKIPNKVELKKIANPYFSKKRRTQTSSSFRVSALHVQRGVPQSPELALYQKNHLPDLRGNFSKGPVSDFASGKKANLRIIMD